MWPIKNLQGIHGEISFTLGKLLHAIETRFGQRKINVYQQQFGIHILHQLKERRYFSAMRNIWAILKRSIFITFTSSTNWRKNFLFSIVSLHYLLSIFGPFWWTLIKLLPDGLKKMPKGVDTRGGEGGEGRRRYEDDDEDREEQMIKKRQIPWCSQSNQ